MAAVSHTPIEVDIPPAKTFCQLATFLGVHPTSVTSRLRLELRERGLPQPPRLPRVADVDPQVVAAIVRHIQLRNAPADERRVALKRSMSTQERAKVDVQIRAADLLDAHAHEDNRIDVVWRQLYQEGIGVTFEWVDEFDKRRTQVDARVKKELDAEVARQRGEVVRKEARAQRKKDVVATPKIEAVVAPPPKSAPPPKPTVRAKQIADAAEQRDTGGVGSGPWMVLFAAAQDADPILFHAMCKRYAAWAKITTYDKTTLAAAACGRFRDEHPQLGDDIAAAAAKIRATPVTPSKAGY